jgi:uncharacterized lipoprotein YddW (UPF0748 family)
MKKIASSFLVLLMIVLIVSCRKNEDLITDNTPLNEPYNPSKDQIVVSKKEIRGAWIATVSNLDWPDTKNNATAQKNELITLLDRLQSLNCNAVILQIRPNADAFYPSTLEPWSIFLTGTQGLDPGYDPLQFAIEESHKRGMEFHAWMNPYRIGNASTQLAASHVALKHPDWVVNYQSVRYFNPGIPEVINHLTSVIKEIITKYDVDAIHFDDFFYPSGAKSTTDPFGFNDKDAFLKYGAGKDVHTWRADNVNLMVQTVFQTIRQTKPGVLFGISPAGKRENSLDLYADPLIWLQQKWVDYLAPQIYWEFGHPTADYGQLSNFWNANAQGVPMIIGLAVYKYQDPLYPAFANVSQFDRQIEAVRTSTDLSGCFLYRTKYLFNNSLYAFLKSKYAYKSVLPFMGLATKPNATVPVLVQNGDLIQWTYQGPAIRYAVYLLDKNPLVANVFNANAVEISAKNNFQGTKGKSYFVTAVNEDNVESARSTVVTLN